MGFTGYTNFQVGAVVEPLVSPSGNALLLDSDPALFFLLDYCSWVITNYPGPRLLAAAGGTPAVAPAIQVAIAQAYPSLPQADHFQENQFRFPLLAIGRTGTLTGRFTVGWEHDRGLVDLIYVLPPLDAAQSELLLPILHAIYAVIREKTTQGWDPNYTPPGGIAGESPWDMSHAGVERIGWGDPYRDNAECATYGFLQGAENQFFPMLRMRGYLVERDTYLSNGNTFAGADITEDLVAADQTRVPAFVQVSTQAAPTLTSLSVSSGPAAGGTSVTLTGTLFLQKPMVLFGNTPAPASSIVWNSSTSVTCVTPAVSGAGVLGVTFVNADGQSVSLPNSWTYV